MYHYTESGLNNIWLENGYREIETEYGKAVLIDDVDGLHQAIAISLVQQPYLSGREFRYLRVHMDLTQKQVGAMMGVDAQSVALWEKKGRVRRYADLILRGYFLNIPMPEILKSIDDASPERCTPHFERKRKKWESQMEC